MKKKHIMALGSAFILLVSNVVMTKVNAAEGEAQNPAIKLIVDDKIKESNLQTVVAGDSLYLPLDTITRALSASGEWDAVLQKYSIIYKDMFAEVTAGKTTMTYGYVNFDSGGSPVFEKEKTYELKDAPMLIDDKIYVPTNFVTEAFGEQIYWSSQDNSVSITTAHPTPTPSPMPIDLTFADTPLFQTLSLKRIEEFHDNNMSFVTVVYDSTAPDAASTITQIKEASVTVGYKVFAVDTKGDNSQSFLNTLTNNAIINNATTNNATTENPASTNTTTTVYFHFSKESIEFINNPTELSELVRMITSVKDLTFSRVNPTPEPSPLPDAAASPSPSPTPVPLSMSSGYWTVISKELAEYKYATGEKFIYVFYNSAETKIDDPRLLLIKEAAEKAEVPIFATDYTGSANFWFGRDYAGFDSNPSPTVYFVRATNSITAERRPTDVDRLANQMKAF